jgi:hypothetical protein
MVTCNSCGIPLGADSAYPGDELYCCSGCSGGGPCICTYEQDLGRYPPAQYARPVSLAELLDRYEGGIQKPIRGTGLPAPAKERDHLTQSQKTDAVSGY